MRSFDGRKGKCAESDNSQPLTGQIEPPAFWLRAFTNGDVGEGDRGRTNRHDQVEDASPADCVDQPTAEYRPDDEGESVAARPNAQRVCALLAVRIGECEQYQRHGHLEGGAQRADNASEDQYSGTR